MDSFMVDNILVEVEVYDRWNYLVRGYKTENEQIVAFLGKYITNDVDLAIEMFTK